nr:hypothetical protein [uncultured Dyadobacter sp.]
MKAANQNPPRSQSEIPTRAKAQSHVMAKGREGLASEIKRGRRKLGTLEGTAGYFMSDDFQITTPEEFDA